MSFSWQMTPWAKNQQAKIECYNSIIVEWILIISSCFINLRTKAFHKQQPDDYSTKLAASEYKFLPALRTVNKKPLYSSLDSHLFFHLSLWFQSFTKSDINDTFLFLSCSKSSKMLNFFSISDFPIHNYQLGSSSFLFV